MLVKNTLMPMASPGGLMGCGTARDRRGLIMISGTAGRQQRRIARDMSDWAPYGNVEAAQQQHEQREGVAKDEPIFKMRDLYCRKCCVWVRRGLKTTERVLCEDCKRPSLWTLGERYGNERSGRGGRYCGSVACASFGHANASRGQATR